MTKLCNEKTFKKRFVPYHNYSILSPLEMSSSSTSWFNITISFYSFTSLAGSSIIGIGLTYTGKKSL